MNLDTTDHVIALYDCCSDKLPVRIKASALGRTNCMIAMPAAMQAEATPTVNSNIPIAGNVVGKTKSEWYERHDKTLESCRCAFSY